MRKMITGMPSKALPKMPENLANFLKAAEGNPNIITKIRGDEFFIKSDIKMEDGSQKLVMSRFDAVTGLLNYLIIQINGITAKVITELKSYSPEIKYQHTICDKAGKPAKTINTVEFEENIGNNSKKCIIRSAKISGQNGNETKVLVA